jgi:hypothetical protein
VAYDLGTVTRVYESRSGTKKHGTILTARLDQELEVPRPRGDVSS